MKLFIRLAIATIAFLTIGFLQAGIEAPSALAAPPANDNLANAITITTPVTPGIVATENNTEATTEGGAGEQTALTNCQPTNSAVTAGRTVWYSWTSPANTGSAALDTWGSNFDTTVAVFSGSGSYPLTLQACNDDRFNTTRSSVRFSFLASTTYYIQVGVFGAGLGGDFVLNLSLGETMYVSNALDIDAFDSGLALREAMNRAATGIGLSATEQLYVLNYNAPNRQPGDLIHFWGGGSFDINLTNGFALPALSGSNDHVSGIGATVEVDGSNGIFACFTLSGPGNQVSGMRIRRCTSTGVIISGATNTVGGDASAGERNVITEHPDAGVGVEGSSAQGNRVLGNYIGTDGAGALGNGIGVVVDAGAGATQVGGSSVLARNVISFNSTGVVLTDAGTNNVVSGNYIGVQANGAGAGNTVGVAVFSNGNTIGGESSDERNVISGNGSRGIDITDGDNNNVFGNYIGLAPDGTTARPNGAGVQLAGTASGNQVGGSGEGEGNVIASNTSAGIFADGIAVSGNAIKGNYIGLATDGETARPNNSGVWLRGTTTNTQIGGTTGSSRNVIAGNTNEDVLIDGEAADGNTVSGNLIGLASDGETVVPSPTGTSIGVSIVNGADNNVIGGSVPDAGNVISGYSAGSCSCGVSMTGGIATTGNRVSGNFIGTDEEGLSAKPNGLGVNLAANLNTVGGTTSSERNVIGGSTNSGIWIISDSNVVSGNYVGVGADGITAVPNGNGVAGSTSMTRIGGLTAAERNVISGNTGGGITFSGGTANVVQGNYVGLAHDGMTVVPNSVGVTVTGTSAGNTIGGATASHRNVISGNTSQGVVIAGIAASGNKVTMNYIGVAADGVTARGNAAGVWIEGGADNNLVGDSNIGNVISGNDQGTGNGVRIAGPGAIANHVRGNIIGLGADGVTEVPNENGVVLGSGTAGSIVGYDVSLGDRNVISGNNNYGVLIDGASNNQVLGNYIGTDASGTVAAGNSTGVRIDGPSSQNAIGGSFNHLRNVLSGNELGLVYALTSGTGNTVRGNYIGLDATGTAALGNEIGGVALINLPPAPADIGGPSSGDRNVISGNGGYGVFMNSYDGEVRGNFIGTSPDGMSAIPNVDGIVVAHETNSIVSNLISGNTGWGIDFLPFGNQGESLIDDNWIGTNAAYFGALGNGAGGIRFRQHPVANVTLSTISPNTVAFNGGPGINVDGASFNPVQGIQRQSIYGNAGLGIDLTNGGNENEPAPLIGGVAGGVVSGFACPGCTVDVYSDGDTEGRFYHATATANGVGQWSAGVSPVSENVTATSTDAQGNTSEFSPPYFVAEPCDGIDNDGDGQTDEGNTNTDPDGQANCIDPDDDNDTHLDGADGCPLLSEDVDGFDDVDGCPDSDNDMDGVCDPGQVSIACSGSDQGYAAFHPAAHGHNPPLINCANVPEDFDAFKDTDGCPEPDNDNDGRPDAIDTCPGDDNHTGPDGAFGAPQDLNHNGIRDGAEPVFTTDDSVLVFEDYDGILDADGCHDSPGDDFDGDGFTDEAEVFTHLTDAGNPDTDADSRIDGSDNCPNWPNVSQNLPNWPIPAQDSDCDGFNKARELHVGTDPTKHCNDNTGVNNEPDAWPGDFNDDRMTNLPDVVSFGPTFNKLEGQPGYNQRYDLNVTNQVLLSDVVLTGPFFNRGCG